MVSKNIPVEAKQENEDCNVNIVKVNINGTWFMQCSVTITNTNGTIQTSNFILDDVDFSTSPITALQFKQAVCFLRDKALTNLGYV